MEGKFSAVFERRGEYWIGFVEELPGANTQGRTLEEARENLVEAVKLIIETNIDDKIARKICRDLGVDEIGK